MVREVSVYGCGERHISVNGDLYRRDRDQERSDELFVMYRVTRHLLRIRE